MIRVGREYERTGRIAVGNDESTITARERIGIPDSLVEERNKAFGVASRAITGHDFRRISDMRLMIRGAGGPVPAAGEHQFKADTIDTISIEVGLVGQEVTKERTLGSCSIIKTVEAQSGLAEEGLGVVRIHVPVGLWDVRHRVGEVALIGVASNHVEILGERLNCRLAGVWVKEVVSGSMLVVWLESCYIP